MNIGYARVSTSEQTLDLQKDALEKLVQPGGKKNPFCSRPYWAILTPYTQTTLPKE